MTSPLPKLTVQARIGASSDIALRLETSELRFIAMYAAMLTIGALSIAPESGVRNLDFTEGEIARQTFPLLDTSDGTVYYYRGEDRKVFARGPKVEAWAAVLEESAGSAMHSAHAGSYQDRSTPGEEKLYVITSNGTQYIPSGTVRRFVVGWGARRIDQ